MYMLMRIIVVLLLFCSCSTTKKTNHTKITTSDTVSMQSMTTRSDTSTRNDNFSLRGLSMDIYYKPRTDVDQGRAWSDSIGELPAQRALAAAKKKPANGGGTVSAFDFLLDHSQITHIHIGIDSADRTITIAQGSVVTAKVDSGAGHHVAIAVDTTEKTTRWPWWIYLIAFAGLAYGAYRVLKRLKIIP